MNQLTAQEAALYLGQEIQFTNVYYNHKDTQDIEMLTAAVLVDISRQHKVDAKLLLRPLSDITEEELQALGYRSKGDFEGLYLAANGEFIFTTKEFAYLLSRGFDLFGFIESGKAIDKTTWNK